MPSRIPRIARLMVAALVGGVLLTGCGLSADQVEYVVYFTPQATDQQKDALRDACPGVGQAVLEPRDRSNLASARAYPVRYDITKASTQDKAAVIECVGGKPGVQGISQSDGSS